MAGRGPTGDVEIAWEDSLVGDRAEGEIAHALACSIFTKADPERSSR